MRLAAFDLGASGGKLFSGRFDGERLWVERVHSFTNGVVQLGTGAYWDFMDIYRQLALGLRKAAAGGPVDSVGLDGFNNDFSLLSREGELLCPVRSYRDARTEAYREAIYQRMSPRELYMLTGNQIAPFNTLMQLAAMVEAGQGYLLEGAHRFLHLPDLLAYYMTGVQASEYTLAAETQFFGLESRAWLADVLRTFGIPQHLFAPVVMPGTRLGRLSARYCAQAGIGASAFISVCEHDTASAFLAAPVTRDAALISSGTWSLVGVEADAPVITEYGFRANIANEGGMPGHHRLLRNVAGMWILQELMRDFAQNGAAFCYERAAELALKAPPLRFLIDVDDLRFFAPGSMTAKVRSALAGGGSAPDSPGEFFRCFYESLAMKYRMALESLEKLTGRRFESVCVLGGGARDAVAAQFTANACGRPVIAGYPDATAMGNMLVQLIAHGEIADVKQGRAMLARSTPTKVYLPREEARWSERYAAFCALYGEAAR